MIDRLIWVRAAALGALLVAATPVAAQEAQGPPDGFLPPAPTRPTEQPAQGPDNGGIAPIATPQPRPQTSAATPTIAIPTQPAPQRSAPSTTTARPRAVGPAPAVPRAAAPVATTEAAPLPAVPPQTPIPEATAVPVIDDAPLPAPVAATASGTVDWLPSWWPWALAALAALVAGVWWLRRDRSSRALIEGADEVVAPPRPAAAPPPTPLARTPAPRAAPVPKPTPPAPIAPPPPQASGRAKLVMTLQVDAIDVLADAARISFSLLLANQGDRAATGGLVRIALQQANRRQAELLERFFDGAGGSVLAEDVEIAAGDVGTIQRHATAGARSGRTDAGRGLSVADSRHRL